MYEHELGDDAATVMLADCGFVVDRKSKRVAVMLSYRWPGLGESRLPVASVFDVASGTVRTLAVEECQRAGQ